MSPLDSTRVSKQRVILGLSGGVDSAVAAILLQRAGADVHALHMTNWEDDDGYCTAADDLQDAKDVCQQLGVPLHHVNFSRQYREQVFSYFLDEYKAGRTPNPDVLCNREIKFGVFRDYAKRLGGKFLATGHYARCSVVDGVGALFKGSDQCKDQSYFLHAVSAEALADTVFPLGDLQKSQVREIARDAGMSLHNKKDSTGICFIGERPFREFLGTYLAANPGPVRTPEGTQVGTHQGLMFYTLGQRQGLGIGGCSDRGEEPWYVVDKDIDRNTLIVAQGEHERLFSDSLVATNSAWIGTTPAALQTGLKCTAKIRYRQDDQSCTVKVLEDDRVKVAFERRQKALTPGQFVVFYEGARCLGGAIIDEIG